MKLNEKSAGEPLADDLQYSEFWYGDIDEAGEVSYRREGVITRSVKPTPELEAYMDAMHERIMGYYKKDVKNEI